MSRLLVVAGIVLGCRIPALGQSAPPALAGPEVRVRQPDRPTLVRWNYAGRLELLDTPPEEAAIDLLELDEATKKSVSAIFSERAALLDRVVIESVELFQQLEAADADGDGQRRAALLAELAGRLRPLFARGTLFDELYEALPRDQKVRFALLVDEYRRAAIEDARRQALLEHRPFHALQAQVEMRTKGFLREIERSFERTTRAGEREFEDLLARLDLSPGGEQTVRTLAARFAEQTKLKPTKAQTLLFLLHVLQELEPADRAKAVRTLMEIRREQRALERRMRKQHPGQESQQPMQGG
ncbi:MAG: hypothetical protein Kow0022_01730 [Phycisphaerales bacterium]